MTPTVDPMLIGLGVLAVVGVLAAFRGGARAGAKVTRQTREVTRMGGTVVRAVLTGAVIVAAQWAVLTTTTDPVAWGVVLGLPAVFAGAALARVFVVTTLASSSGKGTRR